MNAINRIQTGNNTTYGEQMVNKGMEKRKLHEQLKKSEQVGYGIESIIQSSREYVDTLRTQRIQTDATTVKVKKLKYQYKNISSRILRSKTSYAAKQAASQARREVIRLMREKSGSEGDCEEIDAAIAHAKAMERVARKKARHLEEEERARAGGICSDVLEEKAEQPEETMRQLSGGRPQEMLELAEPDQERALEILEENSEIMLELLEENSEEMFELLEENSQEMLELMEEVGLEEFGGVEVMAEDMDPEDLKMMKIKHRNKEMKDIVKADADYLKVVFNNLQPAVESNTVMPAIDVAL